MDPDKALELVKHGASLLLLDVPPSTSFGMDTQIFVVGSNFKGMKMIPPGPHFVYYSAASRHGNESSPVIGFFIFPAPSEVIVRMWDPQEERLVKLADNSEEECFAIAVKNLEFDRYLGPYDLLHYKDWKQLTSHITKDVIEQLEPVGGEITVMSESELIEKGHQTAAEKRLIEQLATARECYEHKLASSGKLQSGSQRCFYTPIPHTVKQRGMSAAELTAMNLDKTQILETLLEQKYGGCEDLLLGELQFAFISFLMGQSLEAFGQWKAIVCLLLSCEEAPLTTRTQFFTKQYYSCSRMGKVHNPKEHMLVASSVGEDLVHQCTCFSNAMANVAPVHNSRSGDGISSLGMTAVHLRNSSSYVGVMTFYALRLEARTCNHPP